MISDGPNKNVSVSAVYCPPRHNIKKKHFADFLKTLGCRYIVGGNYNANNIYFGSRLTVPRGRELKSAIDETSSVVCLSGTPTYWPTDTNKIPDLLDFYIVKCISSAFVDVKTDVILPSDHSSVMLLISQHVVTKICKPKLHNKFTNWNAFREQLERTINLKIPLKTENDIEKALECFIQITHRTAWESTPMVNNSQPIIYYPEKV